MLFCHISLYGQLPSNELALPLSGAVVGRWKVQSVLVDLGTSRTLVYQSDDARLLHKVFDIEAAAIVSNAPEARRCVAPRGIERKLIADQLLKATMPERGDPSMTPTARDYGLRFGPADQITAIFVTCNPGRFGPRPHGGAKSTLHDLGKDTWIALLPDQRIAVLWFDQTVLILQRSSLKGK